MKKEMKLRDLIKGVINDYTTIYLYDVNDLEITKGYWYEDNILKYKNRVILSYKIFYKKDIENEAFVNISYLDK